MAGANKKGKGGGRSADAKRPQLGVTRANARAIATADGRKPFHLKLRAFPRMQKNATGRRADPGRRQSYIERAGAVDQIDQVQSFIGEGPTAGPMQTAGAASFGTLGDTADERRDFWRRVDEIERPGVTTQFGIVAELPYDVSPEARLQLLKDFCESTLASKGLPYWATIHRPDAHNDPRNFHAHILYYDRPAQRLPDGRWDFEERASRQKKARTRYPWGSERPGSRIKRLKERLPLVSAQADLESERARAQLREVKNYEANPPPKTKRLKGAQRTVYPWGTERPKARRERLEKLIEELPAVRELRKHEADLSQAQAWLENPSRVEETPGPGDQKTWVPYLRAEYAKSANAALEQAGSQRRYHPGSYRSLGIDASPTKKLGTKASALEAKGMATAIGRLNSEIVVSSVIEGQRPEAAVHNSDAASRRLRWAEHAAQQALARGRSDDASRWRTEAEIARAVQASFQNNRVKPTEVGPMIGTPDLRQLLKARSALPTEPESVAAPISTKIGASLSARLRASTSAEAMALLARADTKDPGHPVRANVSEALEKNGPSHKEVMRQERSLQSALGNDAPKGPSSGESVFDPRAKARQAINQRSQKKSQKGFAFRVRPTAPDNEIELVRKELHDRSDTTLRGMARLTQLERSKTKDPYEREALRLGHELISDEMNFRVAGRARESLEWRRRVDRMLSQVEQDARDVQQAAKALLAPADTFRARLRTASQSTGNDEVTQAILSSDQWLAARGHNKQLGQAVQHLDQRLRRLEMRTQRLRAISARTGGLRPQEQVILGRIRIQTATTLRWIPPDNTTSTRPEERVKLALDPSRFPAIPADQALREGEKLGASAPEPEGWDKVLAGLDRAEDYRARTTEPQPQNPLQDTSQGAIQADTPSTTVTGLRIERNVQ